jgi:hypothetical protein
MIFTIAIDSRRARTNARRRERGGTKPELNRGSAGAESPPEVED